MPEVEVNKKRIFKNTIMLYFRLLFSMGVSLFSSRIVLNELGVNDFGIYGLVGGIVAIFSFINASMSGATSRFLTVALAKGDKEEQHKTFCAALLVHIGIALIVLILAETVGLWFLNYKLNIAADRMVAANWVYQLSILATIVGITQVPYSSSLIAHERIDIYAWLDIASSVLKLGVALLLFCTFFDKLIYYAILIFIVTFVIAMIARFICIRKYPECKFKNIWDKSIGKPMLSFSGWNLYSNFCFVGRQQGTNILLNIFGGTAVNAAASLAMTVQNTIEMGATNLVTAARPQIISQYAVSNFKEMLKLMEQITILANILYCIIVVPFCFEISYILTLWLKNVPDYTIPFCLCICALNFITINNNMLFIAIQATGRIKLQSILTGTFSLLVIPVIWVLFRMGFSLVFAFIIPIFSNVLIYIANLTFLKKQISEFCPLLFSLKTIGKSVLMVIVSAMILYLFTSFVESSLSRLLLTITIAIILIGTISFAFLLDYETKIRIIEKIKSKIFK